MQIKSDNPNVRKYLFDPKSSYFEMESTPEKGVIWQTVPVDREEQDVFYLTAKAQDASNNNVRIVKMLGIFALNCLIVQHMYFVIGGNPNPADN